MSKRYVSLASKIVMILIVSSISAVLVYSCFREQISHYYSFVDDIAGITEKRTKFFKDFKKKAKDVNLTDKKKIKKLIKTKDPYLSVYIYDNVDEYYVAGNYATVLTEPVSMITPLYILQNDFETDAYNMVYTKTIQFKDQKAEVELYDLNLLKYIKYYFYAALFASFLTFLLPTFFFIRHKVKYIECLKQEILNMSHGDLSHPITIQSRDELAVLAHQMDNLRITLQENNEKEMELQQTHHDLITAMSHDLRTPLTSLRGYLDILALHCFKDQEQMDNYLHRCIDKVEQIKELSNKTFAYSLVFEQNSHPQLEKISTEELLGYIEENLNYLELEGFIIHKDIKYIKKEVLLDFSMIKRMINNLCSNIQKYSDKHVDMTLTLDDSFDLLLTNKKKSDLSKVESNKIGLKSVKRIVELHEGACSIEESEETFSIHISIPLKSGCSG